MWKCYNARAVDIFKRKGILRGALTGLAIAAIWIVWSNNFSGVRMIGTSNNDSQQLASAVNTDETFAPGAYRSEWKKATATVFWVGEGATDENGFIHNEQSAWDARWLEHFGGVDDPKCRNGFYPCAFTPKENPFYVALPYNDMWHGRSKENANMIPWYTQPSQTSILKNRWVEVSVHGKSCFGQWEDVGPFETDDIAYVFGAAEWAANEEGVWAGIDLSPALRDCLGIGDTAEVRWRHVDRTAVQNGPWLEIITTK